MEEIIQLLHKGGYSCVIANKEVRTFTQRGVADLYSLLKNDAAFLKGASLADKVIGKGAAALMILGSVEEIYTDVISQPALTLLHEAQIKVAFEQVVPFIQNRDQTGWCPLERICYQGKNAQDILPLIEDFITKMRSKQQAN